jgi:hypothetical protein
MLPQIAYQSRSHLKKVGAGGEKCVHFLNDRRTTETQINIVHFMLAEGLTLNG